MATAAAYSASSDPPDALAAAPAGGPQARRPQSAAVDGRLSEGLRFAAAGGVAGAFAKSCTAPLARLTILYQVMP